jgi:hypothetical protein
MAPALRHGLDSMNSRHQRAAGWRRVSVTGPHSRWGAMQANPSRAGAMKWPVLAFLALMAHYFLRRLGSAGRLAARGGRGPFFRPFWGGRLWASRLAGVRASAAEFSFRVRLRQTDGSAFVPPNLGWARFRAKDRLMRRLLRSLFRADIGPHARKVNGAPDPADDQGASIRPDHGPHPRRADRPRNGMERIQGMAPASRHEAVKTTPKPPGGMKRPVLAILALLALVLVLVCGEIVHLELPGGIKLDLWPPPKGTETPLDLLVAPAALHLCPDGRPRRAGLSTAQRDGPRMLPRVDSHRRRGPGEVREVHARKLRRRLRRGRAGAGDPCLDRPDCYSLTAGSCSDDETPKTKQGAPDDRRLPRPGVEP